jgi:hypothetical protein
MELLLDVVDRDAVFGRVAGRQPPVGDQRAIERAAGGL